MNETDLQNLRRCVELATQALEVGDEPFASVLVARDGTVLAEERNRVATGDRARHSVFELARWAVARMTPEERAAATVYTSGEHCPMCAAARGWVGLGGIVYASSSKQLVAWLAELGVPCASRAGPADPGSSPTSWSRARFPASPSRSVIFTSAFTESPGRLSEENLAERWRKSLPPR